MQGFATRKPLSNPRNILWQDDYASNMKRLADPICRVSRVCRWTPKTQRRGYDARRLNLRASISRDATLLKASTCVVSIVVKSLSTEFQSGMSKSMTRITVSRAECPAFRSCPRLFLANRDDRNLKHTWHRAGLCLLFHVRRDDDMIKVQVATSTFRSRYPQPNPLQDVARFANRPHLPVHLCFSAPHINFLQLYKLASFDQLVAQDQGKENGNVYVWGHERLGREPPWKECIKTVEDGDHTTKADTEVSQEGLERRFPR